MNPPVVFMFSGQGSQYYQMARELYQGHARFRQLMQECDALVQPRLNKSLIDIIHGAHGKEVPFDRVLHTNPALLAVQYSQAQLLIEEGLKPDYVMGYSLGEFIAAVVAQAISLEQGLKLVVDYAELLEQHAPTEGTMLAILGNTQLMYQYPQAFSGCWLAGRNFDGNFVVSGRLADIERLNLFLSQHQILTQKLPIRHAFHTDLLEPIARGFFEISRDVTISSPKVPIISAYLQGELSNPDINHFWELTRYSVEFSGTVRTLLKRGDFTFIDLGPSGTLATFVKYLLPKTSTSRAIATLNPFGRDLQYFTKLHEFKLLTPRADYAT